MNFTLIILIILEIYLVCFYYNLYPAVIIIYL